MDTKMILRYSELATRTVESVLSKYGINDGVNFLAKNASNVLELVIDLGDDQETNQIKNNPLTNLDVYPNLVNLIDEEGVSFLCILVTASKFVKQKQVLEFSNELYEEIIGSLNEGTVVSYEILRYLPFDSFLIDLSSNSDKINKTKCKGIVVSSIWVKDHYEIVIEILDKNGDDIDVCAVAIDEEYKNNTLDIISENFKDNWGLIYVKLFSRL